MNPEVRVCAWCGEVEWLTGPYGMCLDLDAYVITHGMCPACHERVLAEIEED